MLAVGYNPHMTPKLTDEQRTAVEECGGRPVTVVDPNSNQLFYLLSQEQFSQIQSLLVVDEWDVKETYVAQQEAFREIWDDPALDVYNGVEGESEEL
jgi:hypothetical protein